jgi:hypothetical protein
LPITKLAGDDAASSGNITPTNDILQMKGDSSWIKLIKDENALKVAHTTIASEGNMLTQDLTSLNCLSPTGDPLTKDGYLAQMSVEGKTQDDINTMSSTLSSLPDIDIIALDGGDLIKVH